MTRPTTIRVWPLRVTDENDAGPRLLVSWTGPEALLANATLVYRDKHLAGPHSCDGLVAEYAIRALLALAAERDQLRAERELAAQYAQKLTEERDRAIRLATTTEPREDDPR